MRRVPVFVASLFVVPFCATLSAQPFPSPQVAAASASQPQTIHLDVLVKGQSGISITGVPQPFFTVLDNGQPQKLLSFKQVDPRNDPSAVHVLIVLDMINPGYNSVTWGREQLSEYLRQEGGSLRHRTSLAAMTEDGLQMMNGSTTDGNVLNAQLASMSTHLRLVSQSAGWAGLEQLFNESMAQFSQILAIEQARPGRKLVLFLSSGWPALGWWGSEEDLHSVQVDFDMIVGLTNTLRDARTAIYRLDPFELGGEHSGDHGTFYYQDFLKPVTNPKKATYPFLQLGVFAIHSGGRVMVTGKDITGELNSAKRDGGAYYELTYATPPARGPNEYHAIKVQVNQPGTFVQTIAGYYANPQAVGLKAKKKR